MQEGQFYFLKDLSSTEGLMQVSREVFYSPRRTKFGTLGPNITDFLKFLNIPIYTKGAYNYNALNFSTQVPAKVTYLVPRDLEIVYPLFLKLYPLEVISNFEFITQFTPLEFMVYDCLVVYPNLGDGYYETPESLDKGIRRKLQEWSTKHGDIFDQHKVLSLAIQKNPLVKTFLK